MTTLISTPAERVAVETTIPPGAMPTLHVHDRAETHHVLEGRLVLHAGAEVVVLGPGESFVTPAGVPHTHRAEERTRYVTSASVDSAARYDDWVRAVARPVPAERWEHSAEAAVLAVIAQANGITVLGAPGAISDRSPVLA
ncbi:MAG TPA: cupin domain-containing protein [Solirubrobacteraceae bacterium]